MKIVFFGTPEFAIPSLDILVKSNHDVAAVVTPPDKERGRGKKVTFTPVKKYAIENNIKVLQPDKLKDENFIRDIREIGGDLFVVVAYRILPEEIYTLPPKGAFNLHGSLLPKYRGAAPIQWAIINGDKETGLTTFFLDRKVDTGKTILQERISIDDTDDLGTLHDKMMIKGAELVLRTVEMIGQEKVVTTPQDDSLASPAPKITKEICLINWNKPAAQIHNLVRGLSPYPAAFFLHNNKTYKIFKTKIISANQLNNLQPENLHPGIIHQTKNEIFVGTSDGMIQILELQPEGRNRITAEEFLRGYRLN